MRPPAALAAAQRRQPVHQVSGLASLGDQVVGHRHVDRALPCGAEQHQHAIASAVAELVGHAAHLVAIVAGGIGDREIHALHLGPLAGRCATSAAERLGQARFEPLPLLQQLLELALQVLRLRLHRVRHLRQATLQRLEPRGTPRGRSPPRCAARRPLRRSVREVEDADLPGGAHVGAAAELDRGAHQHHPDHVAVLLGEESHGAERSASG